MLLISEVPLHPLELRGGGTLVVQRVDGEVCQVLRWTTALSSKVNLPDAINFRALCGEQLVTLPP